jgi:Tfp pilus assembly protein PilF
MAYTEKMRRRMRWFLAGTVATVLAGAGAYVVRDRRLDARATAGRAEGLRCLEQGDHPGAMHNIGLYLRRHPDDVEALLAYARARREVTEPDGKHLVDAASILRRVRGRRPDHAAATEALLDLYGQVGWVTELRALADETLARDPAHPAALRGRARAMAHLRGYGEALESALAYNAIRPHDVAGHVLTLQILDQCDGARDRLLAHADGLKASGAADPRFLVLRSLACQMAGEDHAATALAKEAAGADLPDAATALLLARQCNVLELFDLSLSVLSHARARIDDPALHEALAQRLWWGGRHADVVAQFPTDEESHPVGLRAARCMALYALGRREPAARVLAALKALAARDAMADAWAVAIENRFARDTPDDGAVILACQAAIRDQATRQQHTFAAAFFHHTLGDVYARVGEVDAAVKEWRDAARSAPAWHAPLLKLADVALQSGRFDEARLIAEAAERRAPGDREALVLQAAARLGMLRPGDAQAGDALLTFLRSAERRAPGEERLVPLRIRALAQAGRPDEARQAIQAVLSSSAAAPAETLLQLANLSRQARLGLEGSCFDACERAHGMSPDLAFAKAAMLTEAGRRLEGVAVIERAVANAPAGDALWGAARARYLDRIDDPRAADAWRSLADAHPRDARVQWQALGGKGLQADRAYVGQVLDRLKDLLGDDGLNWRIARARWLMDRAAPADGAVRAALLLTEVTRTAPEVLMPRLLLADCLEQLGNFRGAIDQLAAAANLQPDAPEITMKLGWLLHQQGETGRSRLYLDQVLANPAASTEQLTAAADLVAAQGDPEHALRSLEPRLTAGGAERGGADLTLASLYLRTNQAEKAEQLCVRLLDGADPDAIAFVANLRASQGRREEAKATLARLDRLSLKPGRAAVIRARFYDEHGPAELAVPEYEKAVAALPEDPLPRRALVGHLLRTNRFAEAHRAIEEGARAVPNDAALRAVRKHVKFLDAAEVEPAVAPLLVWCLERPSDEAGIGEALAALTDANGPADEPARRLAALRTIADRYPRMVPLQIALAQRYLTVGKAAEAAAVASRAMSSAPTAAGAARVAAQTAAAAGLWPDALRAARAWRARSASEARQADEAIAEAYLRTGNPSQARRQLEPYLPQAIADRQAFASTLTLFAHAAAAAGDPGAAAELLRPALELGASWRVEWMKIAAADVPDPAEAATWLREVEGRVPQDATAERLALAEMWNLLWRRSNRDGERAAADRARRAAAELLKRTDGPAEAFLSLAVLFEEGGDPAAAEAAYRDALRRDAGQRIAQNNLAMLLARQDKNLPEALSLAQRATAGEHPQLASFRDTLAFVQLRVKVEQAAVDPGREKG